eukprot:2465771-Amphidinium_carterae.2
MLKRPSAALSACEVAAVSTAARKSYDIAYSAFEDFWHERAPGLLVEDLLPPCRPTGPMQFAALTVAPQPENAHGSQPLSKTGTIDDTVVVDDLAWLGPALFIG